MKLNKKGAALMQVLLITIVLAGIATMLLRASLSRTTSARKTRRTVSGQVLMQSCMAEVNTLWTNKKPEVFQGDWAGDAQGPIMYCNGARNASGECPAASRVRTHTCTLTNPYQSGATYTVTASFEKDPADSTKWNLVYELDADTSKGL